MNTIERVRGAGQDKHLAAAMIVAAVAGVGVTFALGFRSLAIVGVYIAAPLLATVAIYVGGQRAPLELTFGTLSFRVLVGLFFLLQGIAVYLVLSSQIRPLSYFVAMAAVVAVVLTQILTVRTDSTRRIVILGQIVLTQLNVLWSINLNYHYFFGRTDVFPHSWYISIFTSTGRITGAFDVYQSFPLWHILIGLERLLIGMQIPPRYLMFVTNGVVFSFLLIGVYLLGVRLLESYETALVATLLCSLNTFVLIYGAASLPRSVTSFLGVVMFLSMLSSGFRHRAIVALLGIGIAMYHTVSTPFLLIAVGCYAAIATLVGVPSERRVRWWDLAVVTVIQIGYWILAAPYLLDRVLDLVEGSGGGSSATAVPNEGVIGAPVNELVNYLHFSFFVLLLAYGLLVSQKRRFESAERAILGATVVLALVAFPGPLLLLRRLAAAFNILRFGQYVYPFISLAAAIGLVALYRTGLRRITLGGTARLAVVLLLVSSMSFLAVSNDFVASDNPLVEREFYTYYFTESEQEALDSLARLTPGQGHLMTDHISCKYLRNSPRSKACHILEIEQTGDRFLFGDERDVALVRTSELKERGLQLYPTDSFERRPSYAGSLQYVESSASAWDRLDERDKVYANGDVNGFAA